MSHPAENLICGMLGLIAGALTAYAALVTDHDWLSVLLAGVIFVLGLAMGAVGTTVLLSWRAADEQSRAVAREHARWHHPKEKP